MTIKPILIPCLLASALTAGGLQAAVTITNGDMEINTLTGDGDFKADVPPTGWVGTGQANSIGEERGEVNIDPNGIAWAHTQNKTVASAMGTSIGDIIGNLGITINVTYTVSRRMNEGAAGNSESSTASVAHSVTLYAGSAATWVGGTELDILSLTPTVDTTQARGNAATYYLGDSDLTMPASYGGTEDTLWFVFQNDLALGGGTINKQVLFDDVTVTAVPEPSSAALIGLGCLALILRRRK